MTEQEVTQETRHPAYYQKALVVPYAGLWRRGLAYFLDRLVIQALLALVSAWIPVQAWFDWIFWEWGLSLLVAILYFFFMTSLTQGQTLGKMALRLRVVDANGQTPSSWQLFLREGIGLIIQQELIFPVFYAWLNPYKQTFADWLSDTYVIRDDYYPLEEDL